MWGGGGRGSDDGQGGREARGRIEMGGQRQSVCDERTGNVGTEGERKRAPASKGSSPSPTTPDAAAGYFFANARPSFSHPFALLSASSSHPLATFLRSLPQLSTFFSPLASAAAVSRLACLKSPDVGSCSCVLVGSIEARRASASEASMTGDGEGGA